jgi:hypothetical protein
MVMKQVDLQRGVNVQTAWIEERGARLGATVELKLGEGVTSPGWRVTRVYDHGRPDAEVQRDATAYKSHRKHTDI